MFEESHHTLLTKWRRGDRLTNEQLVQLKQALASLIEELEEWPETFSLELPSLRNSLYQIRAAGEARGLVL